MYPRLAELTDRLHKFLDGHRVYGNNPATHSNYYGGKYRFNGTDAATLHDLIAQLNELDLTIIRPESFLSITEICPEFTNIHIDLDLHYRQDDAKYETGRYYSTNQLINCTSAIANAISRCINVKPKNMKCFVMERGKVQEHKRDGETSMDEGLHIIFPYIFLCTHERLAIYQYLLNDPDVKRTLNAFGAHNDQILDRAVWGRNPWFLYGCGKAGDGTIYHVTHIGRFTFNDDGDRVYKVEAKEPDCTFRELIDILRLRYHSTEEHAQVTDAIKPYLTSIKRDRQSGERSDKQSDVRIDEADLTDDEETDAIKPDKREEAISTRHTDDEIEKWMKLVNIVSPDRAVDYATWELYRVILHDMSPNYQCVWDEFSKRCPSKYNQRVQDTDWNKPSRARDEKATEATIMYHAKIDNPEAYKEWCREYRQESDYRFLTTYESFDLASVVYEYNMKGEYIYVGDNESTHKGTWYHFNGVIWSETDTKLINQYIRSYVPHQRSLFEDVVEQIRYYSELLKSGELSADERECYEYLLKQHKKVRIFLRGLNGFHQILTELQRAAFCFMSARNFAEVFDNDPYKIVFLNGMYDLEKRVFRDAVPQDLVTKQLKVKFIPLNVIQQDAGMMEKWKFIDDFFSSLFSDNAVRKYVLVTLAGIFVGENHYNDFYLWTGCGSNGKSVLLQFIMHLFGAYATTVSVSMLTNKRTASSSATPDLYNTIGKRLISMQEPESNEVFHAALIKELTGNDSMTARNLYSSQVTFKPQFKVICCCNKKPGLNECDEAIGRRIKVIDFNTRFLLSDRYEKHKNEPNVRLADPTIIHKLDNCMEVFANILLQKYYPMYRDEMHVPLAVSISTESYLQMVDEVRAFTNSTITFYDNDDTMRCGCLHLYEVYRYWHSARYHSPPKDKTDFEDIFMNIVKGHNVRIENDTYIGIMVNENAEKGSNE